MVWSDEESYTTQGVDRPGFFPRTCSRLAKTVAFFRGLNHPPIPVFRLSGVATHQVDGVLTKRATRVSLTFRRVRDPSVTCTCDFEKSCDRDTPVATATFLKKEADVGTTGVGAISK